MNKKNPMFLLGLSWFVAALAIFIIAVVVRPDVYIDGFWWRVAWIEFLNVLFWFGNSGWFVGYKKNATIALTPAVNLITSVYCVVSFLLIVGFWSDEAASGIRKIHLVIQVVLFALWALLMLRFLLAAHFADSGLEISDNAAMAPANLAQKIKSAETDYTGPVAQEIKRLRERIEYSLQNTNVVRTNHDYVNMVNDILTRLKNKKRTAQDVRKFIIVIDEIKQVTKRG